MTAPTPAPTTLTATVLDLTALNHNVFRARLRLPAAPVIRFYAGQYLLLNLPGADPAAFSIASGPDQLPELELHIQRLADNATAAAVIDLLDRQTEVSLTLPAGEADLKTLPAGPLLLACGGTGFAPVKSVVEHLIAQGHQQPVYCYWGVRQVRDLYCLPLPQQWAKDHAWFHFEPVVSDDDSGYWAGRSGLLAEAIAADLPDLRGFEAIIAGSPGMVYGTYDQLLPCGLRPEQCRSDVFSYAPRD